MPLVSCIVNNAVPLQPTHQSDAASNHSHPALLSGRLAIICAQSTATLSPVNNGMGDSLPVGEPSRYVSSQPATQADSA